MSILLISASSGLGKTTACLTLYDMTVQAGFQVSGILSPPVFQNGQKIAIRLRDLTSGEERPLARLAHIDEAADIGPWRFEPETISWGQNLLTHLPPTDLLFLDEIGPLELVHGRGLTHILLAAGQAGSSLTVLTVRPALVECLSLRLAGLPLSVLPLTEQNRNDVPNRIFQSLL